MSSLSSTRAFFSRMNLKKAIQIEPEFDEAYDNLGQTLARMGRLDEAKTCFDKSLELDPNESRSVSALTELLVDKGIN